MAFKNYRATLADDAPLLPTKTSLQQFVVHERQRGVRPVIVPAVAWSGEEGEAWERDSGSFSLASPGGLRIGGAACR